MAPPPTESSDSPATGSDQSQRSLPTPFLTKTYQLVNDSSIDDTISWNEDGSTFIVWRPAEFARDLLPKYFKHNNFSSFVRQLNTYGFRKVVPDRWEFAHDCFRKGEKGLLRDIQRRKITPPPPAAATAAGTVTVAAVPIAQAIPRIVSPSNSGEEQAISSNSSPAAAALPLISRCTTSPELLEENERLKKENSQLLNELTQLKGLYNNIVTLMANYAMGQGECVNLSFPMGKPLEFLPPGKNPASTSDYGGSGSQEPLDLLPGKSPVSINGSQEPPMAEAEDEIPRLFGFSIGLKRSRREEEEGKMN